MKSEYDRMRISRSLLRCAVLLAALLAVPAARAQTAHEDGPTPTRAVPPAPAAKPLPADVTTQHTLQFPDRTLHFTATAGAIRLTDDKGAPRADIAFIAYQLEGADPRTRKVTFVFNGGPGFASGWLQVGAVGPWRIPFGDDTTSPSASPAPLPNAETWLDFTDLVFIDPVDTGFSRMLTNAPEERKRMFSVEGDISYLAETIRRWLDRFDRTLSPKYILGESYGGFRAPRLARELASAQGTGVSGLILVSPALVIGGHSQAFDPFYYATRLPSMAASDRAEHGPVTRAQLADVEQYAAGDFLLDAVKGERDPAAIARRGARVAAFTGLDPALVARYHGLIDINVFLHERDRAAERVGSVYDATITSPDPFPLDPISDYADPVLEGLKAPVSSAMVAIYETKLNWRPDDTYRLQSPSASRQWDWGHGKLNQPQSVSALRLALALDPHLTVLIAHGLFDLVTPYFATQLLLNQLPDSAGADRVRLATYPGGHMFYSRDASRAAFRADALLLYEGR
jgi:carboxypeptidase C (cathepsin A)